MPKKHMSLAKINKNDEYYTRYCDVENELKYYDFKNKVVYCNCDGPESAFVKYFKENREALGIKELLYSGLPVSYDSPEALGLLEKCDMVVTNPPFSKLRKFFNFLIDSKKDFLIMATTNFASTRDVFPHIQKGHVKMGMTRNKSLTFNTLKGEKKVNISWFTTLNHGYVPPMFELTKQFDPNVYPTYTNYPAINVDKAVDIPMDYEEEMGVPISFLCKLNPKQFTIVGIGCEWSVPLIPMKLNSPWARKFAVLFYASNSSNPKTKYFGSVTGKAFVAPYTRLIIKKAKV